MRSRPSSTRCAAALLLATVLVACGDGTDEVTEAGEARAEQARTAALDAGLDEDVADFLGLVARGDTGTYEVRYPGPSDGTDLIVTNRPPDRRVEVAADGMTFEVRLVTDGQAFECLPPETEPEDEDGDGDADETETEPDDGGASDGATDELTCTRTDAVVDAPGVFRPEALDELSDALAARLDDYTFEIETKAVAGIEARCLVTRLRSGREDPELGSSGTICASPEGALVLVDQGDERLEATAYTTEVADDAFVRPDLVEAAPAG